jgi:hypothetical protein
LTEQLITTIPIAQSEVVYAFFPGGLIKQESDNISVITIKERLENYRRYDMPYDRSTHLPVNSLVFVSLTRLLLLILLFDDKNNILCAALTPAAEGASSCCRTYRARDEGQTGCHCTCLVFIPSSGLAIFYDE